MREFETGATRNTDEGRIDPEGFLSPAVIRSYSEYMNKNRVQADGSVRDSDNWQKGIPMDAYMKSMFRHFLEVWEMHRGTFSADKQIENLNALLFNVMGYQHELLKETKAVDKVMAAAAQEPKCSTCFYIGDEVIITRAWGHPDADWVAEFMDSTVGMTGTVVATYGGTYQVNVGRPQSFYYRSEVLQLVKRG
jgi:hypothetical protein